MALDSPVTHDDGAPSLVRFPCCGPGAGMLRGLDPEGGSMFLEKLFALASEAAHEEAERIIADEKCAQQRRQEPRTTASATSGDKGGAPAR